MSALTEFIGGPWDGEWRYGTGPRFPVTGVHYPHTIDMTDGTIYDTERPEEILIGTYRLTLLRSREREEAGSHEGHRWRLRFAYQWAPAP